MSYLAIYDDSKRALVEKILNAISMHKVRTGYDGSFVLVNPVQACEVPGLEIVAAPHVPVNYFWVKVKEIAE